MNETFETLLLQLGADTPGLTVVVLIFTLLRYMWPDIAKALMLWVECKAAVVGESDVELMVEKRAGHAVKMASSLLTSVPVRPGQLSVSPNTAVGARRRVGPPASADMAQAGDDVVGE